MRDPTEIKKRDLSTPEARLAFPVHAKAHFAALGPGQHIGYVRTKTLEYWLARYRSSHGLYYKKNLGPVDDGTGRSPPGSLNYAQAVEVAFNWFKSPMLPKRGGLDIPMHVQDELVFCPVGDTYTIGHALQDYVEMMRITASKSYLATNLANINYHIVPRLAQMPLVDFNAQVFRQFMQEVLETPPKRGRRPIGPQLNLAEIDEESLRKRKKTLNALIGILRMTFRLAWESNNIPDDKPMRCLRRLANAERARTAHLSREEARKLVNSCRDDVRNLVLAALYTGCRATELVRMKCSDVGRDGYGVYVTPVKSYRARFVFLPDEAMVWFLKLVEGREPESHLFLRQDGRPWINRSYQYEFGKALHKAGIPQTFTFHGLRHTYASQLIQSGTTVFTVAQQLGHSDPSSVLRTYGHLSPQIRESEIRQRFTKLSELNAETALQQRESLERWRKSLHGGEWDTYARITEITGKRSAEAPPLIEDRLAPATKQYPTKYGRLWPVDSRH